MNGKKFRNGAIAVVAAFGLAIGFTACSSNGDNGGSGGGDSSSGDDSALKGTYKVATDSSFVPFEFSEGGEHVGFDIDIINAIADKVGFEIDLQVTNFDGIIPGLQTGSFDIAIAGITITDERKNAVDFTDPYYRSGTRIGVPVDNTDITSLEDLDGKKVASRLGSAPLDYIKENVPGAEALPFEQLDQMYLAAEGGSADAVFYDAPNLEYYISTTGEGKLKAVGELYEAQFYGIAVSKGNDELLVAMNTALRELIEDGTFAETYEKWFGEAPEWTDDLLAESTV